MKKVNLKKLALMGITGGVLLTVQSEAAHSHQRHDASQVLAGRNGCSGGNGCSGSRAHKGPRSSTNGLADSQTGQYQYNEFIGRNIPQPVEQKQQISEQELFNSLNREAKALYEGLDAEGRELALELANQSSGPFHDNDTAVTVAAKHMADKRASLNKKWW